MASLFVGERSYLNEANDVMFNRHATMPNNNKDLLLQEMCKTPSRFPPPLKAEKNSYRSEQWPAESVKMCVK